MISIPVPADLVGMRGDILLELTDIVTGEKTYIDRHNMITDTYAAAIAATIHGDAITAPTHIAIGEGAPAGAGNTNRYEDVPASSVTLTSTVTQLGQAIGFSNTISYARILLKRVGTSTGRLFLEFQGLTGSVPNQIPNGTPAANSVSNPLAINALPVADYDYVKFTWPKPIFVGSGPHGIVLKSSGYTYAAASCEVIAALQTGGLTFSNRAATYNGTTWASYGTSHSLDVAVIAEHQRGDTTLYSEELRPAITREESEGQLRCLATLTASQLHGYHGELGLFNAASNGTMFCVATVSFLKRLTQTLNIYWVIHAE